MTKNTAVQITIIISVVVLIIAFSTLYIFNSAVNPEKNNIVTENYNIYPNYEWDKNGKQIDKGFKATHSIRVEIDSEDSDKLGSIIDAGANADAGIKAEAVAEGFNKEVGDLISTSVNDFGYYPWNVYSTRGMGVAEDYALAKVEATNIQPGEKEVTASVSATFELK